MTEFIAATVPAKIVRVSGTTLFHVSMLQLGDALLWTAIAGINGLIDPWIDMQEDLKIPPVVSTAPPSGILGD